MLKNQNDIKMNTLGSLAPAVLIHSISLTLVGNHFLLFNFCVFLVPLYRNANKYKYVLISPSCLR